GRICESLAAQGIFAAFPIRALTLPIALTGPDVIGQARTGTGKTLAFGIPMLQRLDDQPPVRGGATRALVVVPTRELAIQVSRDLAVAGQASGARVITVYGGGGPRAPSAPLAPGGGGGGGDPRPPPPLGAGGQPQ